MKLFEVEGHQEADILLITCVNSAISSNATQVPLGQIINLPNIFWPPDVFQSLYESWGYDAGQDKCLHTAFSLTN